MKKLFTFLKQNKALANSLIGSALLFVLLVIIGILYFHPAYGWFSNNQKVDTTGMAVTANAMKYPTLHAWRFDLSHKTGDNSDEDGDTLDKTGTWVDAVEYKQAINTNVLTSVEEYNGSSHHEQIKIQSLHLGTVDNLLSLNEDNCFYIRLDVTEEILQTSMRFYLANTGVHIYSSDGNEVTTAISNLEGDVISKFVQIFKVDVVSSTTAYSLTNTINGTVTTNTTIDELFTNGKNLSNGAEYVRVSDTDIEEAHYIYIRITPDLEKCFEATESIATYMPCQITYDVTITASYE